MKDDNTKFVKINYKGKKNSIKLANRAAKGELRAFVKCPFTGETIRVHPEIVKRLQEGDEITLDEIVNKKFD